MARTCTVCRHPDRPAIDMMLVNHRPFRDIAGRFNISKSAAVRHHDEHLPEALAKAQAAKETTQADDLLAQLRALRSKAMALLLAAEKSGDLRTALLGVREARGCLDLLLEVEQRISRQPTLNLLVAPEWLTVRTTLIRTLAPYPEAKTAVASALMRLEASV
jgi:hypothetical protein